MCHAAGSRSPDTDRRARSRSAARRRPVPLGRRLSRDDFSRRRSVAALPGGRAPIRQSNLERLGRIDYGGAPFAPKEKAPFLFRAGPCPVFPPPPPTPPGAGRRGAPPP